MAMSKLDEVHIAYQEEISQLRSSTASILEASVHKDEDAQPFEGDGPYGEGDIR